MRRIKEQELPKLCHFLIEQFFEKEELQKMFSGIDQDVAKNMAEKLLYYDVAYFFKYGDIFVYDNDITSVIVGMQSKKMSLLKRIPFALKSNVILRELSKEELSLIKENSKVISEVHSTKWFKKYCKNPYYFLQFAVDKNKRGQGIARKMLENFFEYVSITNNYIVLETLTESNVAIYEHFGFETMEVYETRNKELKEYRMLKRISTKNSKKISFGKLSEEDINFVENEINDISNKIDNIL